jgi:hypothetical protein
MRLGLGPGYLTSSLEFEDLDPGLEALAAEYEISGVGAGIDLMLGGAVTPGIVIGGGYLFNQAQNPTLTVDGEELGDADDTNFNFGVIGPFIDVYPDPHDGLHLGAILGFAAATLTDDDGDTDASARGFGGGALAGYDFWVGEQWSLGVLGRFTVGTVSDDGDEATGRLHPMSFSVMATAVFQ